MKRFSEHLKNLDEREKVILRNSLQETIVFLRRRKKGIFSNAARTVFTDALEELELSMERGRV